MFCGKCGKEVNEDDLFCVSCGAMLKKKDYTPPEAIPAETEEGVQPKKQLTEFERDYERYKKETKEPNLDGEIFYTLQKKYNPALKCLSIFMSISSIIGAVIFLSYCLYCVCVLIGVFDIVSFIVTNFVVIVLSLVSVFNGVLGIFFEASLLRAFDRQKPPIWSLVVNGGKIEVKGKFTKTIYDANDYMQNILIYRYDPSYKAVCVLETITDIMVSLIGLFSGTAIYTVVAILKEAIKNGALLDAIPQIFQSPAVILFLIFFLPVWIPSIIFYMIRESRVNKLGKKWQDSGELMPESVACKDEIAK